MECLWTVVHEHIMDLQGTFMDTVQGNIHGCPWNNVLVHPWIFMDCPWSCTILLRPEYSTTVSVKKELLSYHLYRALKLLGAREKFDEFPNQMFTFYPGAITRSCVQYMKATAVADLVLYEHAPTQHYLQDEDHLTPNEQARVQALYEERRTATAQTGMEPFGSAFWDGLTETFNDHPDTARGRCEREKWRI